MNRYCKLVGILLAAALLTWEYPPSAASRVKLFYVYVRQAGGSYNFGTPSWAVTDPKARSLACPSWYSPAPGQYAVVMKAQDKDTGELSAASDEEIFWWSEAIGCTRSEQPMIAPVSQTTPPPPPSQPVPPISPPPPVPPPPPTGLPPMEVPKPHVPAGTSPDSGGITSSCKFWGTCPP